MDEQAIPQVDESSVHKVALAVAVLLFVGLYLSGIVLSMMERSQRRYPVRGV